MAVPRRRKKRTPKTRRSKWLSGLTLPKDQLGSSADQTDFTLSSEKQKPNLPLERVIVSRRTIKQMLYAEDAEGLFCLVRFLPIFLGAWLVSGLVIVQIAPFLMLTGVVVLAQYEANFRQQDILFGRDLRLLLYLAEAGILYLFYQSTGLIWTTLLAAVAVVLVHVFNNLKRESPIKIIISCLALVLQMSFFALLGIKSQTFGFENPSPESWQHAILGFAPGFALASATIAKHTEVFTCSGWLRSKPYQDRGNLVTRPGALSTMFSLTLIAGPAIPLALAPLGIGFPTPFLACGLAFIPIPHILQAFMEKKWSDKLIVIHCINLAAGLALIVFLAAYVTKLLI